MDSDPTTKRSRPLYLVVLFVVFLIGCIVATALAVYFGLDADEEDNKSVGYTAGGPNRGNPENYTVLILGAGASGIAAAKSLHDKGVKTKVLEGWNRIGGRVRSKVFGGVRMEAGANFMYGDSLKNPVNRLAKEVNLTYVPADYDNYIVYNDSGHDVTDEFDKLWEDSYEGVSEKVTDLKNKLWKSGGRDILLSDAMAMFGWAGNTPLQWVTEYFEIDFEVAVDPNQASLKYTVEPQTENYGEAQYFVKDGRGYSTILEHVANSFLKLNETLHLNTVVKEIEYTNSGVKVTTSSGDVHEADFAIVTFSVGVLTHDDVTFKPPLPMWKRESLFRHSMGKYLHIYLKFPRNFWADKPWIMHASSKRGYFPVFCSWDNLATNPSQPKTNMLFAVATDDEAERISKMKEEDVQNEIMVVLRKIYGNTIPNPTAINIPPWLTDPLFRGSFSGRRIGVTPTDIQNIRAPLGRLYFAGEGTSDRLEGYIHGAYISGETTADRMLNCMAGQCIRRY